MIIPKKIRKIKKLKKLQKLKKLKNFDMIDFVVPLIDYLCPIKYSPNGKYDNRYFIICLIDFLESSVSWRKYKGTHDYPIKGKYLNQIHNKYSKHRVYDEINKEIIKKYLKTDRENKLKYQSLDSSYIQNKQGTINNDHLLTDKEKQKNVKIIEANKDLPKNQQKKTIHFIDFYRYNGRKKYFKISIICDSYGVPLQITLSSGRGHDVTTLIDNVNNLPVSLYTLRNSKVNRYKQYLLADSAYLSLKNKLFLAEKGYISLIAYNKKNTKNKEIIKENKFNKTQKKIYKNRNTVERSFSWIKNKPIININYQKKIESYTGLLKLVCSIITSKRI